MKLLFGFINRVVLSGVSIRPVIYWPGCSIHDSV